MRSLRAAARLLGFLFWSGVCWLAKLLGHPLGWVFPATRAPVHEAICRAWARGIAAVIGLHIRVEGRPPRAPFVLVANHLGYIDIVTLMAHAPGVFVSRGDVAGWPVLGTLAKAADTIFIDRALRRDVVRVNALIDAVLQRGLGLMMFPEGTSSSGEQVLPFRSSLLEPAVALGRPVSHATLAYRTGPGHGPAREAVAWWGDMTFPDHFWALLQLPRIDATVRFGDAPLSGDDRHELSRALWTAVDAALPRDASPAPEADAPAAVGHAAPDAAAPAAAPDAMPSASPSAVGHAAAPRSPERRPAPRAARG